MKYIMLWAVLCVPSLVWADTIYLKNGQVLEGKLEKLGNGKIKVTHRTLEMILDESELAKVGKGATVYQRFQAKEQALEAREGSNKEKAQAYLDLANWAHEQGLSADAKRIFDLASVHNRKAQQEEFEQNRVAPYGYVNPWYGRYSAGYVVPYGTSVVHPYVYRYTHRHLYGGYGCYGYPYAYRRVGSWGYGSSQGQTWGYNYGYQHGLSLFYSLQKNNQNLLIRLTP